MFQSSPSLSEGRYAWAEQIRAAILAFQSSPSLSEGRYLVRQAGIAAQQQFQSSPSLSEGRYWTWRGRRGTYLVSILALPFGRALRREGADYRRT